MARTNVAAASKKAFTHEGGAAYAHMTPEQALRRSVMSCMLFEGEFYEDGEEIAKRITRLAAEVGPAKLAKLAIEVRTAGNLRHVPLLLLTILARTGAGSRLVSDTIPQVIQRADELAEFLAIYARVNGVTPDKLKSKLSAQVKLGLAAAFGKFNAYALGKYNRDNAIKLRDVLFLVHAKPRDDEQAALWKKLIDGTLESPDTWEVNLSAGKDKGETFTRLLQEDKLGYLALLRNLRNMTEAKVDPSLIRDAILARKNGAERVLPFRYIAAARACPQLEPALDMALVAAIAEMPWLTGLTAVMVDVSSSMNDKLSGKSDLTRRDAAAALACIIHGDVRMFAFADDVTELPPRRGMAGVDAINAVHRGGTRLFDAIDAVNKRVPYDRLIVITDEQAFPASGNIRFGQRFEQSHIKGCPSPIAGKRGYMINVASAQNGVGYGAWNHIDGFSEQVLHYIHEVETILACSDCAIDSGAQGRLPDRTIK